MVTYCPVSTHTSTTPCPDPSPHIVVCAVQKSYCPYSKRAKSLIQTYALDPLPRIIEVDLRGKLTPCPVSKSDHK